MCNNQPALGGDDSEIDFDVPLSSGSLSWLHRRPLKPGTVAWLVAIRNGSAGQRQLDMRAEPAAAVRQSLCDSSRE